MNWNVIKLCQKRLPLSKFVKLVCLRKVLLLEMYLILSIGLLGHVERLSWTCMVLTVPLGRLGKRVTRSALNFLGITGSSVLLVKVLLRAITLVS